MPFLPSPEPCDRVVLRLLRPCSYLKQLQGQPYQHRALCLVPTVTHGQLALLTRQQTPPHIPHVQPASAPRVVFKTMWVPASVSNATPRCGRTTAVRMMLPVQPHPARDAVRSEARTKMSAPHADCRSVNKATTLASLPLYPRKASRQDSGSGSLRSSWTASFCRSPIL